MQQASSDCTIETFFDQIADPDVFCGGGSVAAITAAGAASTALLVMRLNERRKANRQRQPELADAAQRVAAIIQRFYAAADEDIATLDRLLEAQRALKQGGAQDDYLRALTDAAQSPIELALEIQVLLSEIASQIAISTRFTVSDLGAAAVLAEGACRAALLTAEVNIALLRDNPDADQVAVRELDSQRASVNRRVIDQAEAIEQKSRQIISGHTTNGVDA